MSRKRSARRPRLNSVPVMKGLHDQISMGLHTAYGTLERAPDRVAVDQLSEGLGMVGFAIEGDDRFVDARRQVTSGLRALEQICAKEGDLTATAYELAPVRNAVNVVDTLLPRLDALKLYLGLQKLRAIAFRK